MVFGGLKEKIEEKVVFGALKKLPDNERVMARALGMNKSAQALNVLESECKNLLVGLKAGDYHNELIRKAWKVREFIKDNKRLYTDQEERKDDLFACNELVDSLVKEEISTRDIEWLELFVLKFPNFKKELFVFFDKMLPV